LEERKEWRRAGEEWEEEWERQYMSRGRREGKEGVGEGGAWVRGGTKRASTRTEEEKEGGGKSRTAKQTEMSPATSESV